MSVKRYGLIVFTNRGGERDAKMGQLVSGAWVQHKDYAALADRLRVSEAKRVIEREAATDWQERCARWKAAAKVNKYPNRLFDNAADAIAWLDGGDDE